MPTTITSTVIEKARRDAKPGGQRYDISDARCRGLVLRVGPTGARWQFRFGLHMRDRRLDLGDIDTWSITEARDLVTRGQSMLRDRLGIPDAGWVERMLQAAGKAREMGSTDPAPSALFKWTFSEARTAYLKECQRTLREATAKDYASKLGQAALAVLDSTPLPRISRQDMAAILADIHRSGRETHAANTGRAITAFWSWLERDENIARSGVTPGIMRGLRPPARTIDEDDEPGYVPPIAEVARIIAICRSGALNPIVGSAVELCCWTVQRRRTISEARVADFVALDGGEGLWVIPPRSMKKRLRSGRKRRPHVIPLPPPAWSCVKAQMARLEPGETWLFPQVRARFAGDETGHIHVDTISHTLTYMPGTRASAHDIRRAFGTHGEAILGFLRADTRAILDHAEGSEDVTGGHYALHDKTHRTWPIMRAWVAALEPEIAKAVASLEPVPVIKAAMAKAKAGDPGLAIAAE